MKRCPKCNRTYADDAFTFCLEDGALLSAPYDPKTKDPISTIRSSGPPPTVALSTGPAGEAQKGESPAPTMASSVPTPVEPEPKPGITPPLDLSDSSRKKPLRRRIAISVLALIVIGGALSIYAIGKSYFYAIGKSYCRKVIVSCTPQPHGAGCRLYENGSVLAFQSPDRNAYGVTKVAWSTYGVKLDYHDNYVTLDTMGLAGRRITVTANYEAESWFCSGSASTIFVAQ